MLDMFPTTSVDMFPMTTAIETVAVLERMS